MVIIFTMLCCIKLSLVAEQSLLTKTILFQLVEIKTDNNSWTYVLSFYHMQDINPRLALPIWGLTFQCWGDFHLKHKDAKTFENQLNSIMLVLIG